MEGVEFSYMEGVSQFVETHHLTELAHMNFPSDSLGEAKKDRLFGKMKQAVDRRALIDFLRLHFCNGHSSKRSVSCSLYYDQSCGT